MEAKIKAMIIALICAAITLIPIAIAQAPAQGGNITQVNLTLSVETTRWQGVVGTLYFGTNVNDSINAQGGFVNDTIINVTSACSNPTSISGFIYYSNSTDAPTGLTPGNLTQLDNFVGSGLDNASNTFTTNSTFNIGGPITNVPTTFTYVNNNSQSTVFREGYFNDATGNIVFAVEIYLNTQGYNSSFFDFQTILPVFNQTTTTFYISNDITTTCPSPSPSGGGGSSSGYGCISSWICTEWSECTNNLQTRTCTTNCRGIVRPSESKTCETTPPLEVEEPKIITSLQNNPPTTTAPSEINILATRIHTIPITITNNNPYSIENFHAEIETDIITQTYTGLYKKPILYELFGVLPKQNNFAEHKISSTNIPLTLWPKETITIPLTIIGPPITPRTIQARLKTYSDELLLTTQPITIKTETPPFAFMRQTTQSTTTTYFLIDNRGQKEKKTELEINFNQNKKTMFADITTINLPTNSIATIEQTYRTMFDYQSIKVSANGYAAEAK
jgi:hypothetical protein